MSQAGGEVYVTNVPKLEDEWLLVMPHTVSGLSQNCDFVVADMLRPVLYTNCVVVDLDGDHHRDLELRIEGSPAFPIPDCPPR